MDKNIFYYSGHIIILISIMVIAILIFQYLKNHELVYLFIGLLIILTSYIIVSYLDTNENFFTYKRKPFDYVWTGADPPHFFQRDSYRKPYRDGFKVLKTYPYTHYGPLDLGPQV